MITTHKVTLKGPPAEVASTLEKESAVLALPDYMAGSQLRAVAAELARRADIQVSIITYDNQSQELEVRLPESPECEPVMVDRNHAGDRCQVSVTQWLTVDSQPEIEQTAELISALLRVCAQSPVKASAQSVFGLGRME